MKTQKIYLLILLLFSTMSAHAQYWVKEKGKNIPYKSFKSFDNDTVAYLEYNFMEKDPASYAGLTVKEVADLLPFPIRLILPDRAVSTVTNIPAENAPKREPDPNFNPKEWGVRYISMSLVMDFRLFLTKRPNEDAFQNVLPIQVHVGLEKKIYKAEYDSIEKVAKKYKEKDRGCQLLFEYIKDRIVTYVEIYPTETATFRNIQKRRKQEAEQQSE